MIAMLSYHQALEQVRQAVSALPSERVALTVALDRILAADLLAPHAMPPFDQSLMDGYAARSRDTRTATSAQPVRLPLGPTVTAGKTLQQPVPPRQALRIMTGAPMPPGVDAVIRRGRVVAVTGIGTDIHSAREKAYSGVANLSWDGLYFRKDIGLDLIALQREAKSNEL
jgi:molybdopterin molybdotransferase